MNYEEAITLIQIVCAIVCFFSALAAVRADKPESHDSDDDNGEIQNLTDLICETIQSHAPQLKDNIEKNNALLDRLYKKQEADLLADADGWTYVNIDIPRFWKREFFVKANPLDTQEFLTKESFIDKHSRVVVEYGTPEELKKKLHIDGMLSSYFNALHVLAVKSIADYEAENNGDEQ